MRESTGRMDGETQPLSLMSLGGRECGGSKPSGQNPERGALSCGRGGVLAGSEVVCGGWRVGLGVARLRAGKREATQRLQG